MSEKLAAVRGMKDILPEQIGVWHVLEEKIAKLLSGYCYQEIRMPVVEKVELFKRTVGDLSDIVSKEMYTFLDRNNEMLALRPEATASIARACISNGLIHNNKIKLWHYGPMFRHERPQKGRYRQFHQLSVEALGYSSYLTDVEMIAISHRLFKELNLLDNLVLKVNTLGTLDERNNYRKELIEYFKKYYNDLDDDSKLRLEKNPLRILDSKNPALKNIILSAPKLNKHLGKDSTEHFANFCKALKDLNIKYEIVDTLVRGLDYYTHTVFEWVTDSLGAQGTVCGGGRYNGLIELLANKSVPGCGFAIGIERLVELSEHSLTTPNECDIYFVSLGDKVKTKAFSICEQLRTNNPDKKIKFHNDHDSFKAQFKAADKSGARLALVMGEEELQNDQIIVKYLREDKEQETLNLQDLLNKI